MENENIDPELLAYVREIAKQAEASKKAAEPARKAFQLASAGDIKAALLLLANSTDRDSVRVTAIGIMQMQMNAGDLAGMKGTLAAVPALWTGGFWPEEFILKLCEEGDVQGALEFVARLNEDQHPCHTATIANFLTRRGEIDRALEVISKLPENSGHHRNLSLCTIVLKDLERGRIEEAQRVVVLISDTDLRNTMLKALSEKDAKSGEADDHTS